MRDAALTSRVTKLTLLPPVPHCIPPALHKEADELMKTLDIVYPSIAVCPHPLISLIPSFSPVERDICFRPIYRFFPMFTGIITLHIVEDSLPANFLRRVFELPQLTTLHLRDLLLPSSFCPAIPSASLPLQNLSILGCRTKADLTALYVPGMLCEGLIKHSPSLTSLTVDLFVERAACHTLANLENPPPIHTLKCHGMSHHDLDCALLCSVLLALPTISTLHMIRTPRELAPLLPKTCLPNLRTLTGQIKSIPVFIMALRQLQYLTITDAASANGGIPWETQLIQFLESVKRMHADLKGLAFNVAEWSEELFLCICQLWPGLKELKVQCTSGNGADEVCLLPCLMSSSHIQRQQYFRISFGPRFLPRLQSLELLHIYVKSLKHGFTKYKKSKGVRVEIHSARPLFPLGQDEAEELAEALIHLRRWEKLSRCLREIAFDREAWWHRLEPGGWVLRRDLLPALTEDGGQ